MKKLIAMLLSVAMLVCYMPAMVWAEDEVAEPVVETENAAEPISAQSASSYGTRETAYELYNERDDEPGYGEYDFHIVEDCDDYDDGFTLWAKFTVEDDNTVVAFRRGDYGEVRNIQIYKGNSTTVYKTLDKIVDPENEDYYEWRGRIKADAGDVFYIKMDLKYYYGTAYMDDVTYSPYVGLGTEAEPYIYTMYQEDEDDFDDGYYSFYCAGYRDESAKEVWYTAETPMDNLQYELTIDDWDLCIESVSVYKDSTTNKICDMTYDSDDECWKFKSGKFNTGDKIFIKVVNKEAGDNDYNIRIEAGIYYGLGTVDDPYIENCNIADDEVDGAFYGYGWSYGLEAGDNWFRFNFEDAGWFTWQFLEEEMGVLDSAALYDSEGNLIKDFKADKVPGYGTKVYTSLTADEHVAAGSSYLVRVTFKKASEDVRMVFEQNYIYAELKGTKYQFGYTGLQIKPAVVVKDAVGHTLVKGRDYNLTYSKNISVGEGYAKATAIGKYAGLAPAYAWFNIIPKKTSLKKVSAGKKSFKVTWAKQSAKMKTTRISGYQIEYSTSSTFKSGNKFVKVKGYGTTSKTIKNLKAKKKYYVRIRTYKNVLGYTLYSPWSTKKYVTTKK